MMIATVIYIVLLGSLATAVIDDTENSTGISARNQSTSDSLDADEGNIKCETGTEKTDPKVVDCLNALLQIPPNGGVGEFCNRDPTGPQSPVLPQTFSSQKCSVKFEFKGEGRLFQLSSWLALRQTAHELIFFCYQKGANRIRGTTLTTLITVTVAKKKNIGDENNSTTFSLAGQSNATNNPGVSDAIQRVTFS